MLETEADIACDCLRMSTDAQANLELMRLAHRALAISRDFCGNKEVNELVEKLESFDIY